MSESETSADDKKQILEAKEIEIPVPWGIVAGKAWGDENNTPALVCHGVQDNAGSYDRIIPYLPISYHYICIDLPSHGKSSYFPDGLPVHNFFYVLTYKVILDYLKFKKCVIIGHSLGGQVASLFTQLYPSYVIKLVLLDAIYLFPQSPKWMGEYWLRKIAFHQRWHQIKGKKSPPSYTYEEAVEKLMNSRSWGEITVAAAKALLPRSLEPVGNGKYRFTTDQRMKNFINPAFDMRFCAEFTEKNPITCPFLIVLASKGAGQYSVYFEPLLKEFCKSKNCKIEWVSGGHDVHNDKPEIVGPIIAKFLMKEFNKL